MKASPTVHDGVFSETQNENKHIVIDGFELGDELSDGILVTDHNGVVLRINKAYSKITGISEEEMIGQHMQTFVEKKYINKPVSLLVLKEKKKISIMSTTPSTNSKVLVTGTPIFDKNGEIAQVYTIVRDFTELVLLKEKLEEKERENEKYYKALQLLNENKGNTSFIGESTPIIKIKRLIEQVSNTDATVLITGETGVGKEVIANEIVKNSSRNKQPFVKVNCSAIPETLLESELFGYEKGAFTGAQQKTKLGLFEEANHGTILLDEIGEMPMKLQAKLLRIIQEKEVVRIGGSRPIKIDVRIIAATNQNILNQIKEGSFREDLYYRLNVIPFVMPPLRERSEDIYLLVYHFLNQFNSKYNKQKKIAPEELDLLTNYQWPGNIRELKNTIERLVIIGENEYITRDIIILTLGEEHFPSNIGKKIMPLKEAVAILEKEIITNALKKYGSTHKAAKALGVTQPTVLRKAKSLGITDWKFNND
ncbi:sigma-54 interaction domain-containing protein [Neobacillus niacini]|uniref:sigma-54 interaction domain-containing protein n=1 Tax=Neobacillus niacini TaxID=86668 RepID=UPI0039835E65